MIGSDKSRRAAIANAVEKSNTTLFAISGLNIVTARALTSEGERRERS
jgi:flavin-binding protein dodecin